jgi:iron complex outermembrane recepter protein
MVQSFGGWVAVSTTLTTGTIASLLIQPGWAQEQPSLPPLSSAEIPHINDLPHPATTIQEWTAQVNAATVKVTGIKLIPTEQGLEVILETAADNPTQSISRVEGNTSITDIENAVLVLPAGPEFNANNPAVGVTSVNVTQLDDKTVRVRVVGEQTVPTATVKLSPPVTAQQPVAPEALEEEEEELIVTEQGQKPGYRVPNATTGTKTDTPLRDIPQSIQVIPQEVIKDRQINRVAEALQNISGVTSNSSSYRVIDNFIIRGFDASNNVTRNGLRDLTNSFPGSSANNLEQVEVLKGPASVLYGQGGPGGLINLVTKQPLSDPFYSGELEIGSFDSYQPSFDISGPLNTDKTLLYRFNGSYLNANNFIDFFETTRLSLAPTLKWSIDKQTTLTLEGEYQEAGNSNNFGLPARGTVLPNLNGKVPISRTVSEPDDFIDTQITRLGYRLEHNFNENWTFRNAFGVSLASFDQKQVFPLALGADDRTVSRIEIPIQRTTNNYNFVADLTGKFKTGSIQHQLLVGFDLFRQESWESFESRPIGSIDLFNPIYGAQSDPPDFASRTLEVTDSLGFYLQDQVTVLDNLKLLVGGRFDLTRQSLTDDLDPTVNNRQSNEAFSPRLGIVYQPIEPISLYASFSKSFNPVIGQGFNNAIFKPERGTQYEVGIKADLTNEISATLAFYQLTRQNVETDDPGQPGFSIQTGEQRSRGIEFDLGGEILPGWKVIASYAYTDARLTKDNTFAVGNFIDNVPEHSASLWTTYEIQNGAAKGLGFGLGLYYVGDRAADLDNSFELPSYLRTDASIFYRRKNWRMGLNFKNLFDVTSFEGANNSGFVFPGAPFSITGSISVEF